MSQIDMLVDLAVTHIGCLEDQSYVAASMHGKVFVAAIIHRPSCYLHFRGCDGVVCNPAPIAAGTTATAYA